MNHTWNYALLAAELDAVKTILLPSSLISIDFLTKKVNVQVDEEVTHRYRIEEMPEKEIKKHLSFVEVYPAVSKLYKLPLSFNDEDSLISFSILLQCLESSIYRYKVNGGVLSYYYGGEKIVKRGIEKYEVLVCAKMLREGYRAEVIPGSHFYIYNLLSPSPRKLYTTQNFCTCDYYEKHRTCNHTNMVKGILEGGILREI